MLWSLLWSRVLVYFTAAQCLWNSVHAVGTILFHLHSPHLAAFVADFTFCLLFCLSIQAPSLWHIPILGGGQEWLYTQCYHRTPIQTASCTILVAQVVYSARQPQSAPTIHCYRTHCYPNEQAVLRWAHQSIDVIVEQQQTWKFRWDGAYIDLFTLCRRIEADLSLAVTLCIRNMLRKPSDVGTE